jgi:dihydroorotate dehydrogenase electron transfer subunit
MKQRVFTITDNAPLTERVSLLRLRGDCSAIERPGQFVELALPGFFLRRPFSVCDWEGDELRLVYEQAGKGTELLRGLPAGEKLDLLTGLGNGFDLRRAGDAPLLIGGGSGVSPLLGLARRLLRHGCAPQILLGFNTRDDLILLDDFFRLGLAPSVTTVDGSFGIRGFVTAAMEQPHSFFYACGPLEMLRAVCEKSPAPGQLSLDARMGCGFGACMGCTIQTVRGPKRVCKDGPVFDKEDLLWAD